MKGCFLLQRRFAVIGHAIALNLKQKYGIENFCGYVHSRSSYEYLKNQSDITYRPLLLDEDIHNEYKQEKIDLGYINRLEKEYGMPNLWSLLMVDRVIMHNQLVREYPYDAAQYSHEEMMRIIQVTAKKIIKLFDEEKPDFVFFSVVGSLGSMLLYQIAKKRKIPVLVATAGRMGDLLLLSENYENFSWADTLFEKFQKNQPPDDLLRQAQILLEKFREKPAVCHSDLTPDKQMITRRKQLNFLIPTNALRSLSWFFKFSWQYAFGKHNHDYAEIKPWFYLIDRIKRKLRCAIGFTDLYDKIDKNDNYMFFPLHFEPEISTMLYAPFFTDQLYVIKQISRSLPISYKLYVKEHPAMAGYRSRSYYKKIKKNPNVKLIDPNTTGYELINNAKIIATISGTAGWEGILLKKPVITFGNIYYNKLRAAKHCVSIEQLPYLIKNQLENYTHDETELLNYLSAMLSDGIDVPLMTLWEKEIDNFPKIKAKCESIVDLIAKKLNIRQSQI